MASRSDKDLTFALRTQWRLFKRSLKKCGYDAILTCTYRSNEEQDLLYAQGRTTSGSIVTHYKGGKSLHNSYPAKAFDIAILEGGKCNWDTTSQAWEMATKIAKILGLKQLKFEMCHFQMK